MTEPTNENTEPKPSGWEACEAPLTASPEPESATYAEIDARKRAEAEELARLFHEIYEALAPEHGYKTREASAKPWADVPEANKGLMIAVAGKIIDEGWLSPEKFRKIKAEHRNLLDVYTEACKAAGMGPDEEFHSLPQVVKDRLASTKQYEKLASERYVELIALRRRFQKELDNISPLDPLPEEVLGIPPARIDFNALLNFAAGELYDAAKGYAQSDDDATAEQCRNAAQAVLEVSKIMENPMKTVTLLAADRDQWQIRAQRLEETGGYTEIALFDTQTALIDLTKGHDRMIRLLERFAQLIAKGYLSYSGDYEELNKDVTALLNSGDVRAIQL
jgi:hypothetical protein